VNQPYGQQPGFEPEIAQIENDALLWLIVGGVGFWFGFGWVTGPLAWYFGARARNRYLALGRTPSSQASAAWVVGILSTLITYMTIAAIFVFVVFIGAALFTVPL